MLLSLKTARWITTTLAFHSFSCCVPAKPPPLAALHVVALPQKPSRDAAAVPGQLPTFFKEFTIKCRANAAVTQIFGTYKSQADGEGPLTGLQIGCSDGTKSDWVGCESTEPDLAVCAGLTAFNHMSAEESGYSSITLTVADITCGLVEKDRIAALELPGTSFGGIPIFSPDTLCGTSSANTALACPAGSVMTGMYGAWDSDFLQLATGFSALTKILRLGAFCRKVSRDAVLGQRRHASATEGLHTLLGGMCLSSQLSWLWVGFFPKRICLRSLRPKLGHSLRNSSLWKVAPVGGAGAACQALC